MQKQEGKTLTAGNWLFLGSPGTGKTTVARCMGTILCNLGVIASPHVVQSSAADLSGSVVGEAKTVGTGSCGGGPCRGVGLCATTTVCSSVLHDGVAAAVVPAGS